MLKNNERLGNEDRRSEPGKTPTTKMIKAQQQGTGKKVKTTVKQQGFYF